MTSSSSTESNSENEDGIEEGSPQNGAGVMRAAGMGSGKNMQDMNTMWVKKIVSKNTVLYCPFVNNLKELGYDQPFARITMGFLGKQHDTSEEKSQFWEEYKQIAHKTLNVKRSNISGQLRKHFVCKLSGKFMRKIFTYTRPNTFLSSGKKT